MYININNINNNNDNNSKNKNNKDANRSIWQNIAWWFFICFIWHLNLFSNNFIPVSFISVQEVHWTAEVQYCQETNNQLMIKYKIIIQKSQYYLD